MPHYVTSRIGELLNEHRKPVAGSRVLLLGVAYKRDVADVRESPAFALARRLRDRGAELCWHDPHVVIHTDHSAYDWPAIVRDAPLVFDTRNATAGITDPRVRRL
jgi:UDP-N-acetyl-D-glucosamine dehydrogenase